MPVVTRDHFGLRTSDPRSQAFHRLGPDQVRQARLHIASFNGKFGPTVPCLASLMLWKGTLAGGLWSSRKTVVPEFVKLISGGENVFETPLNGVGADGSWTDFVLGGRH
jgi:hypothetical protein